MEFGYVHSYETGAAVDGPGVRFALFIAGCPFRCTYCHNPDTWDMKRGKRTSSDQVLQEIAKYASFLRIAGGLTITGGEPLTQPDFVHEIFLRAKNELKLHTALDTQGYLAAKLSDAWFDPIDLVLLDIKIMNPEKHLQITGKELQPSLDFALRLNHLQKKTWLRYVLIPGITDAPEDIDALANFISSLACIERVEVLPFHNLGIHKWKELNLPYTLKNQKNPSPEEVRLVQKKLDCAIQKN